eukprot:1108869-Prymnesium_polylepis.4
MLLRELRLLVVRLPQDGEEQVHDVKISEHDQSQKVEVCGASISLCGDVHEERPAFARDALEGEDCRRQEVIKVEQAPVWAWTVVAADMAVVASRPPRKQLPARSTDLHGGLQGQSVTAGHQQHLAGRGRRRHRRGEECARACDNIRGGRRQRRADALHRVDRLLGRVGAVAPLHAEDAVNGDEEGDEHEDVSEARQRAHDRHDLPAEPRQLRDRAQWPQRPHDADAVVVAEPREYVGHPSDRHDRRIEHIPWVGEEGALADQRVLADRVEEAERGTPVTSATPTHWAAETGHGGHHGSPLNRGRASWPRTCRAPPGSVSSQWRARRRSEAEPGAGGALIEREHGRVDDDREEHHVVEELRIDDRYHAHAQRAAHAYVWRPREGE